MISKATLKKPWRSPRGKVYPPGSTFKLIKREPENSISIYKFFAPGLGTGWVKLPDRIFKKLTEEEARIKIIRKREAEEHMRKTRPFY